MQAAAEVDWPPEILPQITTRATIENIEKTARRAGRE